MRDEIEYLKNDTLHCINMVDMRKETYEKNGTETAVDSNKAFYLNGIHIEKKLYHNNVPQTIKNKVMN